MIEAMKQAIWTQDYSVNTIVLNPLKRLGLVGLLNILQDAAWIHAKHLGHGYEAMLDQGTIWVLSRQKLIMGNWPVWGDQIRIRTWVRPLGGPLAQRDYEILANDGQVIGQATSSWLVLDMQTRRPAKLRLTGETLACRDDKALDQTTPGKIAPAGDAALRACFQVRNSDLDVNGHVNNTRYAQWILDSVPFADHQSHRIDSYEVNFLSEVHVDDEIAIHQALPDADGRLPFQGQRAADGKTVFTARLGVSLIDGRVGV